MVSGRYLIFETNDGKIIHVHKYTGLGPKILLWMNGKISRITYSKWDIDITDVKSNLKYRGLVYNDDPILKNSIDIRTYVSYVTGRRPECLKNVYVSFIIEGRITEQKYVLSVEQSTVRLKGFTINENNIAIG